MKDWRIIINDFDLNERVQIGCGDYPVLIKQTFTEYSSKEEVLKEYNKLIDKYMKKSHYWKGHSQGAIKFYYNVKNKSIYTLILVHYKGEEVSEGLFD